MIIQTGNTTQLVKEGNFKSTVSSTFDYVQGTSNSPYIIATSMVPGFGGPTESSPKVGTARRESQR